MRAVKVALQLNLPEYVRNGASVPIVVNGRRLGIPRRKAYALAGIFGMGDIKVTGQDAVDALAILRESFPRWMFHLGRHLQLTQLVMPSTWHPLIAKKPCHIGCNVEYVYYVFGQTLPHANAMPYGWVHLTKEFLSTPQVPDFVSHIPESEADRITYFIHRLPRRKGELRRWMLLHPRQLVRILQNIKKAYESLSFYCGFFHVPPLLARHEYRAVVAQTFGEWYTVGGPELMIAMRRNDASPLMRDAGLVPEAW